MADRLSTLGGRSASVFRDSDNNDGGPPRLPADAGSSNCKDNSAGCKSNAFQPPLVELCKECMCYVVAESNDSFTAAMQQTWTHQIHRAPYKIISREHRSDP